MIRVTRLLSLSSAQNGAHHVKDLNLFWKILLLSIKATRTWSLFQWTSTRVKVFPRSITFQAFLTQESLWVDKKRGKWLELTSKRSSQEFKPYLGVQVIPMYTHTFLMLKLRAVCCILIQTRRSMTLLVGPVTISLLWNLAQNGAHHAEILLRC